MKRTLVGYVAVPLLCAFAVSLLLHTWWNAGGFFISLASNLISILVTIFYVEWVIRLNEKVIWRATDIRIADRLRILLNGTLSGLRNGLGFSADLIDERVLKSGGSVAMHNEVIRIAEDVIQPVLLERLGHLDQEGWAKLARHIQQSYSSLGSFIDVFQNRFNAEQLNLLLDLQDSLSRSLTYYSTFPDIAGVPRDQLPDTRTPAHLLQEFGIESTSKELQRTIELTKTLSRTIRDCTPS